MMTKCLGIVLLDTVLKTSRLYEFMKCLRAILCILPTRVFTKVKKKGCWVLPGGNYIPNRPNPIV